MSFSEAIREIDRLFRSAAVAAGSENATTATLPDSRSIRNLAAIAALATASVVHAQAYVTVYVDDDAPPGGDGASWATAYSELGPALEHARAVQADYRNIHIAEGVYCPRNENRWAPFRVTSGMALTGGFAGLGHPNPDAHDPVAFVTVLTGDVLRDDGAGFTNRGDNEYTVVTAGPADWVMLQDLTIRGGRAADSAGIRSDQDYAASYMTLVNCRLIDNTGAAVFATDHSWVTLRDCKVEGNQCDDGVIWASRVEMYRCVVQGNTLDEHGWGNLVFRVGRWLTLEQCLVVGAPTPSLTDEYARPLIGGSGSVIVRGCTIATADTNQTVMSGGLDAVFVGSIVTSLSGRPARLGGANSLAVSRCCLDVENREIQLQARTAVVGPRVLFASPRLVAPLGPDGLAETYFDNDFRLSASSPAIDIGDVSWLPSDYDDFDGDMDYQEPIPFDLSGAPRIHDDSGTPNLGVGQSGAIDLGPYEFQGTSCRADYDASGIVGVGDLFAYLHDWFVVSPDADFNRSGETDLGDLFDFLAAFFAGCP